MSPAPRSLALVAITLSMTSTGCFATRSDVRVLQTDLATMRSEFAHRDSLAAAQSTQNVRRLESAVSTQLAALSDSMRLASARVAKWEAGVNGDMRSMQEQLLQIQELVGQSQRRLQDLRADMEQRSEGQAAPATGTVDASRPASGSPGPNQLYQLAADQLQRGSYGTARAGFEDLLRQYPTSDRAPDAMFNIAESFAAEGRVAEADSVYQSVVRKYPRAAKAPTALYKHGLLLKRAGRERDANAAFERVVREYPRSDEAVLARGQINGR